MKQKEYKDRTTISLSIERNLKEEIEELAGRESFSSFVNRVLQEEIQRKKVIGLDNPINISFGMDKDKRLYFQIELGKYYTDEEAKELIEKLESTEYYSPLYASIKKCLEQLNFKQTGKYSKYLMQKHFVNPEIKLKRT